MTDRARRRELLSEYRRTTPEAGVYALRNTRTGRVLLGSSPNLAALRNRFEFARSTASLGALDQRLRGDAAHFGIDAFELEILEVLDEDPARPPSGLARDLATLEELWREKLAGTEMY